jgi:hypothetical protein
MVEMIETANSFTTPTRAFWCLMKSGAHQHYDGSPLPGGDRVNPQSSLPGAHPFRHHTMNTLSF